MSTVARRSLCVHRAAATNHITGGEGGGQAGSVWLMDAGRRERGWSKCWHTWRVTWSSLKTLRIFFHELRVITFPIDYHWKRVRRPFCFMQIIRWKLKIRLGNRAHRIQNASIMLKRLVPHFYPKMHLDDYWRPFFRNPYRLCRIIPANSLPRLGPAATSRWSL